MYDEFDNAVGQIDFFQNGLRCASLLGVVCSVLDGGANLLCGEVDVADNFARCGLTVTGRADGSGATASGIAP